jgi:LmbE family N-acetylglucosaminyl deacetylase
MAAPELTLMVVHAHPDDEASSTGGILHRYALEGIRTVLVTCTGGELGDGPGGVKPDQPGHDEAQVRATRRLELERACDELKVGHLEMLGYLDSGMAGWPQNNRAGSFSAAPLEEALARLLPLLDRYRPQVLVSYDEQGGYGHPDHIRAHHLAREAALRSEIPLKLYYTAFAKSSFARALQAAKDAGVQLDRLPTLDFDPENPPFGVDDELITTTVAVSADVPAKLAALRAHASQADNGFLLDLPEVVVATFMGQEHFIRAIDSTNTPLPESDLFAGLRPEQRAPLTRS